MNTDVGEARHFFFRCHFCGVPTRVAPHYRRLSCGSGPDRAHVFPSACFDCTTHDDGRADRPIPTTKAGAQMVLSAEDHERRIGLRRGR